MPSLFSHFIRPPIIIYRKFYSTPCVRAAHLCETSFHIAYRQAVIAITIWREFRPGNQQLGGTATSMAFTELPRQSFVECHFLDNRYGWVGLRNNGQCDLRVVDHHACLRHRGHGLHNIRQRCNGRYVFDVRTVARKGSAPLRHYASMVALISIGLSMIGIAQGLRLLLLILGMA